MEKITFVVPSRNNLEFLKLCIKGLKNLSGKHEILVLNDASTDGTKEWLESLNDDSIQVYENPGPERIGIVGMFDKGIEMARTDIICAYHADMVASPNLDVHLLKYLEHNTVVTATRVEPPLHPPGPEKIIENFGIEVEEFDFEKWIDWCNQPKFSSGEKTEGIFAPWCMYKEDFIALGGHDKLFAPQSKEDSDLFNRMSLAGYKFIQTWDGLVYHFTSRGSRFNKHSGGAAGQNSQEWIETTTRNGRNFIRKWGHFIKHDEYMKPIIHSKYNIGAKIINCNSNILKDIEPWFDNIYVDCEFSEYVESENTNTVYDIESRCHPITKTPTDNIVVEFDCKDFTARGYEIIMSLSEIFDTLEEPGEFKLESFIVKVNKVKKEKVKNYALSYNDAG